jgi:hypothetical protein
MSLILLATESFMSSSWWQELLVLESNTNYGRYPFVNIGLILWKLLFVIFSWLDPITLKKLQPVWSKLRSMKDISISYPCRWKSNFQGCPNSLVRWNLLCRSYNKSL